MLISSPFLKSLDPLFADVLISENGMDFHAPELIAFIYETLNKLCNRLA